MNLSFENTAAAFGHKNKAQLRKAYLLFRLVSSPALVKVGKIFLNIALKLRIPIAWAVKPTIFQQFCGGETIQDCAGTTKILDQFGIGTILDYSVEGKSTDADFDATCTEILATIQTGNDNEHIPFCVFKVTGIGRFSILQKVNEKKTLTELEQSEFDRIHYRIDRICAGAAEAKTPVFIDAEESWIQDTIDALAEEMMEKYNLGNVWVYNTVQLYRHDRLDYLKRLHRDAKAKKYLLGVKLVRGAYMEKERARAKEKGYASPIQPDKSASDRDYDAALKYCVEHVEEISSVAGTHNEASSKYLAQLIQDAGLLPSDGRLYFAQLYGMSDHISFNLSAAGYKVAKYVPYGPIREVMPYLLRRAEENTSVKGQTSRELSLILQEMERRNALDS
jgi:proline dehydrogenase